MARERGAEEGLFLNTKDCLAEGTVTNLFLVKGDHILTPGHDSGILSGITRAYLMASGPNLEECQLGLADLLAADEAFLTNAVLEVAPLVRVDGQAIGSGRPGPVTERILGWYRSQTGK